MQEAAEEMLILGNCLDVEDLLRDPFGALAAADSLDQALSLLEELAFEGGRELLQAVQRVAEALPRPNRST